MATSTPISILDYLQSSYRPDREFVDGVLLERSVGKWEHARVLALLALWFGSYEKAWAVKVATEQRVRVSPERVRIPDVILVSRGPHPEVLVSPLSWSSRYSRRTTPTPTHRRERLTT